MASLLHHHHLLLLLLLFLRPIFGQTQVANTTTPTTFSISDSPWLPSQISRKLLSPNSIFSSGFLPSPFNSSIYTFTVWVYSSASKTPVWSLGPVSASSPLFISQSGALVLAGLSGINLFPSTASGHPNPALRLNNDGSLTFANWTSFSSPTDTLLPNQHLAFYLSSGNYRFNSTSLSFNTTTFWSTQTAAYLTADGALVANRNNTAPVIIAADYLNSNMTLRRLTLDIDGNLRLYSLLQNSGAWVVVWEAITELCLIPNTCGPHSICIPDESFATTKCICAPGFGNFGAGCVRKKDYLPSSKFLPLDYVTFTAEQRTVELSPMALDQCQSRCLADSGCVGFSYTFDGWQGCLNHFGELVNGFWSPNLGNIFFLRVANSETDISNFSVTTSTIKTFFPEAISLPIPPKVANYTVRNAVIFAIMLALELLAGALCFISFLRRYSGYRDMARSFGFEFSAGRPERFSYTALREATGNFSSVLGKGGFGVVYRGNLSDGRKVAVKQLRGSSGDDSEFWAEVAIIARMHHLNLVRIWGFCAEKEQRLLVYEYVPNGSLDKMLFTGGMKPELDLSVRFRIALGVARAIAYLHEECLEWVLHCDIKPENILLDDNFCPKVSDFGLSKLASKKDRVTMSMMRGTRGYMAPEWVMKEEPITAKADVYSFGVVLLELVAGIRCWDFRRESLESVDWNFPRWAYDKVFVERKVVDVVDKRIAVAGSSDEKAKVEMVDRMVKTAMWCLQDRAEARPSMGKVAKMLEGTAEISEPVKPSIFYLAEVDACSNLPHQSFDFGSTKSLVTF